MNSETYGNFKKKESQKNSELSSLSDSQPSQHKEIVENFSALKRDIVSLQKLIEDMNAKKGGHGNKNNDNSVIHGKELKRNQNEHQEHFR